MAEVRRRLRVTGRVQGVSFRAHAVDEARRLGLAGWVRNRADGSVEALAQGEAAAVDAFAAWCRRGPRAARVEQVAVEDDAGSDALGPFGVRGTA